MPVQNGYVFSKLENAESTIKRVQKDFKTEDVVIKAQIHAGGRGKGGGVKYCRNFEEAMENAKQIFGMKLVTHQTGKSGQLVKKVFVTEAFDIFKEYYAAITLDRNKEMDVFMVSSEGGIDIEKVAEKTPEKIIYESIDPLTGPLGFQARKISKVLGLDNDQSKQFSKMLPQLTDLFISYDLSLLEINPLVITKGGKLHCLDAKINIDSNAIYRQPEIQAMHDPSQEDPREAEAAKNDLSYVSLDGNIGCMVNGAGLAMGTMDTIKYFGGSPANFLDVGGTATQERVSKAFKLILADPEVKVVLVNIFGGIVRCDLIAEGILAAIEEVGVSIPVVVRLEGNNADIGSDILAKSNASIESLNNLEEASKKAVELSR